MNQLDQQNRPAETFIQLDSVSKKHGAVGDGAMGNRGVGDVQRELYHAQHKQAAFIDELGTQNIEGITVGNDENAAQFDSKSASASASVKDVKGGYGVEGGRSSVVEEETTTSTDNPNSRVFVKKCCVNGWAKWPMAKDCTTEYKDNREEFMNKQQLKQYLFPSD